jgi:hypothetical protein
VTSPVIYFYSHTLQAYNLGIHTRSLPLELCMAGFFPLRRSRDLQASSPSVSLLKSTRTLHIGCMSSFPRTYEYNFTDIEAKICVSLIS